MTGNDIKRRRQELGLTQGQAAQLCGRSQGYLSTIEFEKEKELSPQVASAFAPLFGEAVPVPVSVMYCQVCRSELPGRVHGNTRYCDVCFAEIQNKKRHREDPFEGLCMVVGCDKPRKTRKGRGRPFKFCKKHTIKRSKDQKTRYEWDYEGALWQE